MTIERPDQVWSMDITYVPLAAGFMYLAAIMDWFNEAVKPGKSLQAVIRDGIVTVWS